MISDLAESLASVVAPPARVRPSAWAEANIWLPTREAARPGPFSCSFKPWVRDLLDVCFDEPDKVGFVCMKPSQCGISVCMLALCCYYAAAEPGPNLYLVDLEHKARTFNTTRLQDLIGASSAVAKVFAGASDTDMKGAVRRPYRGGHIDFGWARSESGVISNPYRLVVLDEYQLSSDVFPGDSGDLFQTALARIGTYLEVGQGRLFAFGHPSFEGTNIHALFKERSDQRFWTFPCPACGERIRPSWSHVHLAGARLVDVEKQVRLLADPHDAEYRCPTCRGVVSDADRARLTRHPVDGGQGKFVGALPAEEAAGKLFVGLAIDRLADPDRTLAQLAREYLECPSADKLQSFYNKTLGEPVASVHGAVSLERVAECLGAPLPALPGGVGGVKFLVGGVDVQAPAANPTLYLTVTAYASSGHRFVVVARKLQGWAALYEFLRKFTVTVEEKGNRAELACPLVGVDCGAWFSHVADACRVPLHHASPSGGGAAVQLLPLRFEDYVKADRPWVLPPIEKRLDPSRPHLLAQERYDLNRNHFVDRAVRALLDKRTTIALAVEHRPDDLLDQLTAQAQRPKKKVHGLESDELVWEKAGNDRRDDWLMSLAFSEAAAVIKRNLNLVHEADAPGMERKEPGAGDSGGGGGFRRELRENFAGRDRPWRRA